MRQNGQGSVLTLWDGGSWRWAVVALVLAASAVFLPALKGGALFNDDREILSGAAIGGGNSFLACFTQPFLHWYYRPLTSASLYLDLRSPFGSVLHLHMMSLLYHAVTAILLAWLVHAATARRILSLAAGLFFAVQPAQVLVAGWVGGRTDDLSALFATGLALCLVKWRASEHGTAWYWAGVVAFFAGLLAKEQGIALLPLAPLAMFAFPRSGSKASLKSALVVTIPFLAAAAIYGLLWFKIHLSPPMEGHEGLRTILGDFGRSAVLYPGLFLTPTPTGIFSFSLMNYPSIAWPVAGLAIFAMLAGAAAYLWRRVLPDRPESSATVRLAAFAAAWALLGYLPVSNLIPIPSYVVGSYRVGVCGPAVSALLAIAAAELWNARRLRALAVAPLAAGLCGFLITPWACAKLVDEPTFFTEAHAIDPRGYEAGVNCAAKMLDVGKFEEAQAGSEALLDYLFGNSWRAVQDLPRLVKTDAAFPKRLHFRNINGADPRVAVSRLLGIRAVALVRLHRIAEARRTLEASVAICPMLEQLSLLGAVYMQSGDPRWVACYERAFDTLPTLKLGVPLSRHYAKVGDVRNEERVLTALVKQNVFPGDPIMDLGELRIREGRIDEARTLLARAGKIGVIDKPRLDRLLAKASEAAR